MVSEALKYHIASERSLMENVFRYGTRAWCELIREARALYEAGELTELYDDDLETLEGDIAKIAIHPDDGEVVLEVPQFDWDQDLWVTYVLNSRNEVQKVNLPRNTFPVYGAPNS